MDNYKNYKQYDNENYDECIYCHTVELINNMYETTGGCGMCQDCKEAGADE